MTVTPEVRAELAKLNPSSMIELFEVKIDLGLHGDCGVYRFHSGVNAKSVSGHVIWKTKTYYAWPVEADGFEYSGKGTLPRPTVRIANLDGAVTAILAEVNQFARGSDLTGAEVKRIRTLARFLDAVNFEGDVNPFGTPDPNASLPEEIYFIDRKSVETNKFVEFELACSFDLAGVRVPRRQTINNTCQWVYRGSECGYTGSRRFDENDNLVLNASEDVCGKRLSSCQLRFPTEVFFASPSWEPPPNQAPFVPQLPFGAFPGVGQYTF